MSTPGCAHPTPSMPDEITASGGETLSLREGLKLIAAAADGCGPCQQLHTGNVLDGDPEVVAHLATQAFLSLKFLVEVFAPGLVLNASAGISSAGVLAEPTRRVYRMLEQERGPGAVAETVKGFTRAERAAVLDDAVDGLAGAALSIQR